MENTGKALLTAAFGEFLETGKMTPQRYFSPEYRQWSDGVELDYAGFCHHLEALSSRVQKGYVMKDFVIEESLSEGDRFVSRHRVMGATPEGRPYRINVIAIFALKDGKFISCNELSHTEGIESEIASTRS